MQEFGFSWLLAFMFYLSLALGALFLVILHHLTDAGWSVGIRHPEQRERVLRLLGRADRDGDPAGFRQHVVRAGAALGDQLVADPARERKVGDPVAMEMPELAPANAELDAAESVRRSFHARPRLHDGCDVLTCVHTHAD